MSFSPVLPMLDPPARNLLFKDLKISLPDDWFDGTTRYEQNALLDAAFFGVVTIAFMDAKTNNESLKKTAQFCRVCSRRRLFRLMRLLGRGGILFRDIRTLGGAETAWTLIVMFVRHVQVEKRESSCATE